MSSNFAPTPAPVNVWHADWPWAPAGLTEPGTFAALYRAAAARVADLGYDPYVTYHGTEGHGVAVGGTYGALALAVKAHLDGTTEGTPLADHIVLAVVAEWVETLEKRLGAVLFLTGQMNSQSHRDLADTIGSWELKTGSDPEPDQATVIAVLNLAAQLVTQLAAPAPADAQDA